ncbi:NIL domain-containing protein [Propionibacterium australiense]|uniref:Uncharacterized protein n=1 Tax=Propionibacterium australiense TaxID=119981 RepID=A0A383S8V9_9ACTN|nr:NIL domain-containing protein [Propionibacterium australiense]RLP07185.1 hypothetical protein D9T14_10575 [Propionibacterium australiense]RLP07527.1 hypothetical protein D7U36_10995 [Propionibacterium australiense]SYZ34161.1 Hypothetical protein PROPAUS_2163 [Propionibacterium australiense]VEH92547.1 Uncharacterised protein [Propionibacterium australiense]
MTLDLFFVQKDATRSVLDRLTTDLGLASRVTGSRTTTMEIFPVHVTTVEFDADADAQAAATSWFDAHGIHWIAR